MNNTVGADPATTTKYFVSQESIVREIWGNSDTILFIFAGAAAEFALNKAVDWLYFTGRLPADPLGRLFSTVDYARAIIFSEEQSALHAIDKIAAIHSAVESKRGTVIPQWAYQDVLFLLIDYSIRSFELLERPLSIDEKREVFDVFQRVGLRMGLLGLPNSLEAYEAMRLNNLSANLERSTLTIDLFRQYRKHLGSFRYWILLESQMLIVPETVRKQLGFRRISLFRPFIGLYKLFRIINMDKVLKAFILPSRYKKQISALDIQSKPTNRPQKAHKLPKKCPFH